MTKNELKLLDYLIDYAADELSNDCCNEIPDECIHNFSREERIKLDKEFHKWNGDPEEHDPDFMPMYDSSMLRFLYAKMVKEYLRLQLYEAKPYTRDQARTYNL